MPGHGGGGHISGGGSSGEIHSALAGHHNKMAGLYGELAENYGPTYGLISNDLDDDILYPNKCSYSKLAKHHEILATKHAKLAVKRS
jgi:hypothetical protein